MALQLCISFLIYASIFGLKNIENELFEQAIEKTKQVLSYDVNIANLYQSASSYINEHVLNDIRADSEQSEPDIPENEQINEKEPVLDASYTKASHETVASSFNVMFEDIQAIKESISMQKPIEAIISSRFGAREQTSSEVTPYHSGTDFAAPKGSEIRSVMDGTVTYVSLTGTFGKHCIITNGDVTALYAHCDEINVQER